MLRNTIRVLALIVLLAPAGAVLAQVPVIDSANLTQATQTARNTAQIMDFESADPHDGQQNPCGCDGVAHDVPAILAGTWVGLLHVERPLLELDSRGWRHLDVGPRSIWLARVVDHQ